MMGEAIAEQTLRQTAQAEQVAIAKADRREKRKRLRAAMRNGKSGLLLTLAAA